MCCSAGPPPGIGFVVGGGFVLQTNNVQIGSNLTNSFVLQSASTACQFPLTLTYLFNGPNASGGAYGGELGATPITMTIVISEL
jgi:hypothetical protein